MNSSILVALAISLTLWQLAMITINVIGCRGPKVLISALRQVINIMIKKQMSFVTVVVFSFWFACSLCLWPGLAIMVNRKI